MTSLRSLIRSAPRKMPRALISMRPTALASIVSTHSSLLRARQTSAFSTSLLRKASADETSKELAAKLASELEFEKDVKENEPVPASIKDFLDNSPFQIQDTAGKEQVVLKRTFGSEKITVSFSIADLQRFENDLYNEEQDEALNDQSFEGDRQTQRQQNDEHGEEGEGEAGEGDGESAGDTPVPVNLQIVIEKPGKGALGVSAIAQDSAIVVEDLHFYRDTKMAHAATADAAHAANDLYSGPPFGSLDEDLQVLVERYLEERGITQELAVFVPDYIEMKEQKEYITWLNNVRAFVDA